MINASLVAHQIIGLLPQFERPEHTEQYEGFFHLTDFRGNVEKAEVSWIIRDHSFQQLKERKKLLTGLVQQINQSYGKVVAEIEITDQYFNMRQKIEPVMFVVDIARKAMLQAGVEPKVRAIRGGTDGARLSYEGLPCPNIFAGGHNFHGPYEFVPVQSMEKAVEVIVNIAVMVSETRK